MTKPTVPVLVLAAVAVPALLACGADQPSPPRQQDELIEVMTKRIQATNAKDFAAWEALHAPGACRTAPELPAPLCGREAMRAAIEILCDAFPDYSLELLEAFGEDERLAVRIHASGTHSGALVLSDGTVIPPTGRRIDQEWVALVAFDEAGLIVRFDEFYDQFALLVQLGLAEPL